MDTCLTLWFGVASPTAAHSLSCSKPEVKTSSMVFWYRPTRPCTMQYSDFKIQIDYSTPLDWSRIPIGMVAATIRLFCAVFLLWRC
jgi:hypothetical protein